MYSARFFGVLFYQRVTILSLFCQPQLLSIKMIYDKFLLLDQITDKLKNNSEDLIAGNVPRKHLKNKNIKLWNPGGKLCWLISWNPYTQPQYTMPFAILYWRADLSLRSLRRDQITPLSKVAFSDKNDMVFIPQNDFGGVLCTPVLL